jgi:uracil-DNA glycosylase family 4
MGLNLDQRRRAMLAEMKVPVWWLPGDAPATQAEPAFATPAEAGGAAATAPARQEAAPVAPIQVAVSAGSEPGTRSRPAESAAPGSMTTPRVEAMDWPALVQTVSACRRCGLCDGRQAAVMAAEPVARQADWLVVGDAPNALEERDGLPFVGPEGQLLDNMLQAVSCRRDGQGRAGARLTNVVKCRPAVARNPQIDELEQCAIYLRREIALTQPRVILAMGRFAAMSLLSEAGPDKLQQPFGQLRGRVHHFGGVPVVVTYPPAKLLRAPLDKAHAWADLCLARSLVEQAGSGT